MANKQKSIGRKSKKGSSVKKAPAAAKPVSASETKGFNTRTKEGRAKLDAAMLKKLTEKKGKSRGDLAKAVGADERAVSASLLRLEESKAARREGNRPNTVWLKVAAPSA